MEADAERPRTSGEGIAAEVLRVHVAHVAAFEDDVGRALGERIRRAEVDQATGRNLLLVVAVEPERAHGVDLAEAAHRALLGREPERRLVARPARQPLAAPVRDLAQVLRPLPRPREVAAPPAPRTARRQLDAF